MRPALSIVARLVAVATEQSLTISQAVYALGTVLCERRNVECPPFAPRFAEPCSSVAAFSAVLADADDAHGAQAVNVADAVAAHDVLGAVYEQLLHPGQRRMRGAHFTPPDVAQRLVAFALEGVVPTEGWRALDPSCGGGVFLVAAAEWLAAHGWSRHDAAHAVFGIDIDPLATWVSRTALALWAGVAVAPTQIVMADAMSDAASLPTAHQRFDAVLGNPPFLNQLERATARSRREREAVADRHGTATPYANSAALFITRALDVVHDGGRVALIQPHSTLAARDATAVRVDAMHRARLVGLWFATDAIFAASVRVCAPVLQRVDTIDASPTASSLAVRRVRDRAFVPCDFVDATFSAQSWAPVVVDLFGVPLVRLSTNGVIGDRASATAGFRDEYYGLIPAVREQATDAAERHDDGQPRLITSGLLDVLGCAWGTRATTFARAKYLRPVIDREKVDARLDGWLHARLVPKVLIATQSKTIECFVDERGDCVPSTPVVALHAQPEQLWHLAAALSAPCLSAHAFEAVAGAALSANSIKLAARQVLLLGLPANADAWDRGAALARDAQHLRGAERRAALAALGATMNEAYDVHDEASLHWWLDRLGG